MARREVEEWFWQVGSELHRISEELANGRPKVASGRAWEPRIDLIEHDRQFLLKAEIAGVRGEEIQLLYLPDRHSLLLRGHRDEEDYSDELRTGIHQLEVFYGEFQREVRLPETPIDASNIRAQYRNGFLLVTIPKLDRFIVTESVTLSE
ncbi:MAG: Hsp20/alpha crystallin family protein [Fimbriimonas sp.]|nr:Hsp20/alpha crystallin family protein [Fimbriimonas sp.]